MFEGLRLGLLVVGLFALLGHSQEPVARGELPLEALSVGHWVTVRGALDAEGLFVAESVELIEPQELEELIGTVPERENGRTKLMLFGQEVHLSAKTDWSGLEPGPLGGQRVKIEGLLRGPRNFSARKVKRRDPGSDRVLGRVDWLDQGPEGLQLGVLSVRVRVPAELGLRHERPLEAYPITATPARLERALGQDEDDQLGSGFRLAPGLVLSGQLEFKARNEAEYDLDWGADQDRFDLLAASRLRLDWNLRDDLDLAIEWRHGETWRDDGGDPKERVTSDKLGETYLAATDFLGLGLDVTLGRQDFDDPREWLYDQNLDALRTTWLGSRTRLDLSVSTTLTDGSPRDEAATNGFAYLSNHDSNAHLAAYALHRDFGDGFDESQTHAGVRAIGSFLPQQDSWLELGWAAGTDGAQDFEGWAFDVGTVWEPEALPVHVVAGWAWGSGDEDSSDGKLDEYRQTGLQDNTAKLGGITSVRYYGEVFDPELSNLSVLTGGLVLPIGDRESASLLWHKYDQVAALDSLRDSDLDMDPSGLDRDLGWELDFVLGSRRFANWDIELIAGYFEPGDAFPLGQAAALYQLQIRYRF